MDEIKQYVHFNPGLMMNTHYLTEQMAYFLGGIYSSEEEIINTDGRYKVAPVRYNYSAATNLEINQHYELVKNMAISVNGKTYMTESIRGTDLDSGKNRMPGFSTFFKSTSLDALIDTVPDLYEALKQSPWSVQRAFLVGVFDGRGSPDIDKNTHKVRMLSLDCISDNIGLFLSKVIEIVGIRHNYNKHRDRLEGGRPRNPQLRIQDVEYFISKVGLISPRRINLLKKAYEQNGSYNHIEIIEDSATLLGLKTIQLR